MVKDMRRKDREIKDYNKMLKIIDQCDCIRIGFQEPQGTYILPLNFGYESQEDQLTFYFHGAKEGKKVELTKEQNIVGFELDTKHELVQHQTACGYSYLYQSIIGKGKLEILDTKEDKIQGLTKIMSHYSDKADWTFAEQMVNSVNVWKLTVTEWSCKEH